MIKAYYAVTGIMEIQSMKNIFNYEPDNQLNKAMKEYCPAFFFSYGSKEIHKGKEAGGFSV
jgi:hypothetical protein